VDDDLELAISVARANWKDWRDVYEHKDSLKSNPLLAAPGSLFRAFCKEYSVYRTIRAGTHDDFRRKLVESRKFANAIRDRSGRGLDELERQLRSRFGTHDPPRRMISVISKVAAFVKPDQFVAWDQYAKKGVNILLGRKASFSFECYSDYLAAFNAVWDGEHGRSIREYAARKARRKSNESERRFLRRVLDVYAMKRGGRLFSP
jgi:hypothetical protein